METFPSTLELNNTYSRPDTISLCLQPYADETQVAIVDWDEVDEINGDYGTITDIYVTGIPIYPDTEKALETATRYVFNQIEIFEKIQENKELLANMNC